MYDYGSTDIPEKGRDKLAQTVIRRFREAVSWSSTERAGSKSLRRVLSECHDQINGILAPSDAELAAVLGVDVHVNLTAMKCGVVHAFLLETLTPSDELPWTLAPTPIPSLSEQGRMEVLQSMKAEVFASGFDGDLLALAKMIKAKVQSKEVARAEEASRAMLLLMFDQCVEGGWTKALTNFLFNFVVYPHAIMLGPVPTKGPRLGWAGDKLRIKEDCYYKWESINPFDFWFSPDSRNTQDGTGLFIRRRMTRRQLLAMADLKSYLKNQVLAVLNDVTNTDKYHLRWLSNSNPDQPDDQLIYWAQCSATIDVLVHYGYFSGRELSEYGIRGLEATKFYNATVTLIGGYTVQVFVQPDPTVNIRPVHTASFYRLSEDRIPGAGIAQRLRDIERIFLMTLRYLARNVAATSEPVTEMEATRFSKYQDVQDLVKWTPGLVLFTDSDLTNANTPAIRPYHTPSMAGAYQNVLEYFMEQAHLATNIPAALHGTAVGTGANRTFRGASLLQSNAMMAIQAAVKQIDEGVFKPTGEMLYNYNMVYEKDLTIKGDSKVYAQGVQGLLAREIDANKIMDRLQVMGVLAGQLGQTVVPALEWVIKSLLKTWRMPEDILAGLKLGGGAPAADPSGTPSPEELAGGTPPPTAAGVGVPNPNPGPPVAPEMVEMGV